MADDGLGWMSRPMGDRPKCCWTNCDNPAGGGTWTEVTVESSGSFTLPVCEEHWFGNWRAEKVALVSEVVALRSELSHLKRALRQLVYDADKAHFAAPTGGES